MYSLCRKLKDPRVIAATPETYRELIPTSGNALLTCEFSGGSGTRRVPVSKFRTILSEYGPDQIKSVIVVDLHGFRLGPDQDTLQTFFYHLYCDGVLKGSAIPRNEWELRAYLAECFGPPALGSADYLYFAHDLGRGAQVTILNLSGSLTICDLAEPFAYFSKTIERQRDRLNSDKLCIPYHVNRGRRTLGLVTLVAPVGCALTWEHWEDCLLQGHLTLNLVKSLIDGLPDWKGAAQNNDGFMREIILNLEKPGGDLHAFGKLLQRRVSLREQSRSEH
jgi:hypothetical protein